MSGLTLFALWLILTGLALSYGPKLLNTSWQKSKRFKAMLVEQAAERIAAEQRKVEQESNWYFDGDEQ